MGGGSQVLKRIPRIKFPQRHPNPSSSDSNSNSSSQTEQKATIWTRSSEVPLGPQNMAEGGKASLQPKRTPVTNQEIEAVLLGGCFE